MDKKVLFVHDHRFYSCGENIYSGGGLPAIAWERYLEHFGEVTVLARYGGELSLEEAQRMAISSRENVAFELCNGNSNFRDKILKRKEIKILVESLVSTHDAVVARLGSELGLLAIKEARRQAKSYAIELVECTWDAYWNHGGLSAKIYAPIMFSRVRNAVYNASKVLYVTNEFLQKRYPTKACVVASCSNVNIPDFDDDVLSARVKKLKRERDVINFGIIGSLDSRIKGFDVAFKALASIGDKIPNFRLRILGGGDPQPWQVLAEEFGIADKVIFDGVLPSGAPVFSWLDSLDIYLHPSFREGLPRAVIEAMGRGCPVIASSVAGTPELLNGNYLFQRGDDDRLAKLILKYAFNLEALEDMALENFAVARSYSLPVLKEKRAKFYSELV